MMAALPLLLLVGSTDAPAAIWADCKMTVAGKEFSGARYGWVSNDEAVVFLPAESGWPSGYSKLWRGPLPVPSRPDRNPASFLSILGNQTDPFFGGEDMSYFEKSGEVRAEIDLEDRARDGAPAKLVCAAQNVKFLIPESPK